MDDFYNKIKNITNDNIDELCSRNLSEMVNNMGVFLFDTNAQMIINDYLNTFGNMQIDTNNKVKLADFLLQSMESDKRIEIRMWNSIYARFNVGNINVRNDDAISEIIMYFLAKTDLLQQPECFWVKIYILAYIHENKDAEKLLSQNNRCLVGYQREKFTHLYRGINGYEPIILQLEQQTVDDLLFAISSESKLTPTSQPLVNSTAYIVPCYNLKAIQKKAGNIEGWENVLDFLVLNRYVTVRNQSTFDMAKNFGNISRYLFPDEEVFYYVKVMDDIVNHNEDALVVLNVWGTEYLTYNLLPKQMDLYRRELKENSSNLEEKQDKLNQLQQQLKESRENIDKMSEKLDKYKKDMKKIAPSITTIVSLIISIIPFVTTNISLVANEASSSLIRTVNGCLILVVVMIYSIVNYIILDNRFNKKVWILLASLIASFILIA